mgnify:CR=1 FL=1
MSYLLFDLDKVLILKRTQTMDQANLWADICAPQSATRISPLAGSTFAAYTENELIRLARSVGSELQLSPYANMIQSLVLVAKGIAMDETPIEELRATWNAMYPKDFEAPAPTHQPRVASTPRAPRPESTSVVERPKAGSTTGRVWEICDKIDAANPGWTDKKDFRVSVMKACVAAGINEATAATQYSKWAKHQTKR